MKYYETHEKEYQRRLAAGQVAWDAGDYDSFYMRPLVERLLDESGISPAGSTGLELGCGTGGLACMLASRGFAVTGIDVAQSAIAEAKKQAATRKLQIDFRVGDLCRERLPLSAFNLIIDNHFLHCIVRAAERRFVLLSVGGALKPGGEFWIETMVGHPDMGRPDGCTMDEKGVVWHEIPPGNRTEGCVERDGRTWIPTRLIQPSEEALMSEIRRAGFDVPWQETVLPSGTGTATFQARCRPRPNEDALTP